MRINKARLQEIILEEYMKEELLDESQAAEDLLRRIIGDEEYNRRRAAANPDSRGGDTSAMDKPNKASETMPMDSGETHPIKSTIDGIYALVSEMDPEDVKEIFQIVFEKLPGVELTSPGDEGYPEQPPTEYTRGAYGRPKISSFGLDEIKEAVFARLMEYRGLGAAYKRDEKEVEEISMPGKAGILDKARAAITSNIPPLIDDEEVEEAYEPGSAVAGIDTGEERMSSEDLEREEFEDLARHYEMNEQVRAPLKNV